MGRGTNRDILLDGKGKRHNSWMKDFQQALNEPPTQIEHGDKYWEGSDGGLHRDFDLPAVECENGTQKWYQHGKLHREGDEPAVVYSTGTRYWYQNGKLHREGGKPAAIHDDGTEEWFVNGRLHREGGKPARIYSWQDLREYWEHGNLIRKEGKDS